MTDTTRTLADNIIPAFAGQTVGVTARRLSFGLAERRDALARWPSRGSWPIPSDAKQRAYPDDVARLSWFRLIYSSRFIQVSSAHQRGDGHQLHVCPVGYPFVDNVRLYKS